MRNQLIKKNCFSKENFADCTRIDEVTLKLNFQLSMINAKHSTIRAKETFCLDINCFGTITADDHTIVNSSYESYKGFVYVN